MLLGPRTEHPCCPAAAAASCTCPNPSTDSFFERIWCLLFLTPRSGNCSHWAGGRPVRSPAETASRRLARTIWSPTDRALRGRPHSPRVAGQRGLLRGRTLKAKACLNFFLLTQSGNLASQLLSTSNSAGLQALLLSFPSSALYNRTRSA